MKRTLLCMTLCLLLLGVAAQATPVLGVDINSGVINAGPGPYALGFEFQVIQPVAVVGLAVYDAAGDGLNSSHTVWFWDSSGTVLATVTVAAGTVSPLIGNNLFRWATLTTPIYLQPGLSYVVAAGTDTDIYASVPPGGQAVDPRIQFTESRIGNEANLPAMPTGTDTAIGYFGGSIVVDDVPEPVTFLLLGLGMVLLGCGRVRKSLV
jgi:hypothetical protein